MATETPSSITIPVGVPLECQIEDEYIIGHTDAVLRRTIKYSNPNSAPSEIPIILKSKKIEYPLSCDNFLCEINDEGTDYDINEKTFTQVITLKCEDDYKLRTGDSLKVVIECRWKYFVRFLDDWYFTFQYPDIAQYRLIISGVSLKDKPHIVLNDNNIAEEKKDYFIQVNAIHFTEINITPFNPIRIHLLTLSTPKILPTLHSFSNPETDKFANYIIILIQHLLSDVIHLIDAFVRNKAIPEHIFIIGIPYSTKEKTKNFLEYKGFPNIETPKEYPFDESVRTTMGKAIALSEKVSKKILIVEDGGYAVPILHEEYENHKDKFIGAVEQTANGIWRDEEITKSHCLPIIDVARSKIKTMEEGPLIGKVVRRNVEALIGQEYYEISDKKIGLNGYGTIGSEIAEQLKSIGAKICIYDNDLTKKEAAQSKGFEVVDSAKELVRSSKVIIEATGREWCKREEILEFEHGSYFLNASSKRMGIKYDDFEKLIDKDLVANVPGIGTRYTLVKDNKVVTLLADGFPVNFFAGESVPDKAIAFIIALLFKSAEYLIDKNLPNGIISMNDDDHGLKSLQDDIYETHKQLTS